MKMPLSILKTSFFSFGAIVVALLTDSNGARHAHRACGLKNWEAKVNDVLENDLITCIKKAIFDADNNAITKD